MYGFIVAKMNDYFGVGNLFSPNEKYSIMCHAVQRQKWIYNIFAFKILNFLSKYHH